MQAVNKEQSGSGNSQSPFPFSTSENTAAAELGVVRGEGSVSRGFFKEQNPAGTALQDRLAHLRSLERDLLDQLRRLGK